MPRHIEVRTDLSHGEFAEWYRHRRPVILRGLAADWPAQSSWTDLAHLRTLLPRDVLVLRSPDGRTFLKRDCESFDGPFAAVADLLFGGTPARPQDRLYARAPLEGALSEEIRLDALEELVGGAPGTHQFNNAKCGVWLGSAGCVTPLHFDLCHGFLAGVRGAKHFTYFSPDDFRALNPRPEQADLSHALTMDLEAARQLSRKIDAWRHRASAAQPGPAEAEERRMVEALAWHASVEPGDVLYSPPYWWHHVATGEEEAALSVLVPFDPSADEPLHECFR